MNKKMRELLNSINEKRVQARKLVSEGKKVEAKNLIEEIKALQEDYDIEAALYEDEKTPNPSPTNRVEQSDEMRRRVAFNRAVLGKNLDPQDKGLVEGTDADGGYLVPKEQKTQINELRRSQVALKDYCNVIVVHSQAGSMPLEVEASDKLTDFTELGEITQSDIKFGNVAWKCKDKGDIIPISNTLLQDETANLTSYCGRRFAKKAVRTENADIITLMGVATLVGGKTFKDINLALNTKLPIAVSNVAKIFTNQTGFNYLDTAREDNGDKILKEDKTSPSGFSYANKHIIVLDDTELVTTKPTFYVGSLEDYVAFFDRDVYEMAASDQAGFTKNATLLRVIERYDVQKVDTKALAKVELTIGG